MNEEDRINQLRMELNKLWMKRASIDDYSRMDELLSDLARWEREYKRTVKNIEYIKNEIRDMLGTYK